MEYILDIFHNDYFSLPPDRVMRILCWIFTIKNHDSIGDPTKTVALMSWASSSSKLPFKWFYQLTGMAPAAFFGTL